MLKTPRRILKYPKKSLLQNEVTIKQHFSAILSNETLINARFLKNDKISLRNIACIENKNIVLDEIASEMVLAKMYIRNYMSTLEP